MCVYIDVYKQVCACVQANVYMCTSVQHRVLTRVQASTCTIYGMYISSLFLTCLLVFKDEYF